MKLWSPNPEKMASSNAARFLELVRQRFGRDFPDFHSLYSWSIAEPERFWDAVWTFCGIRSSSQYTSVLEDRGLMPGARWFSGAKLNFAENLLRYRDDRNAFIFWGEDKVRRTVTYRQLYELTASLAGALTNIGIGPSDRLAGFIPNIPESAVAMLAGASIGAIWTSCSPDFGVSGVLDRFGQTAPRILFCSDGYYFKGARHDSLEKVVQIKAALPSLEKVVVIPYTRAPSEIALPAADYVLFDDFLRSSPGRPALDFAQLPFDHPLYIMYSSGTTGKPKCIVHGAGGTLIEHLKELIIHTDLRREDAIFYQTTCGWMMWNWLMSSLAAGATLVLYDGFPLLRKGAILWDMAHELGITVFGTNAKYLAAIEKEGLRPIDTHDLPALRTILSTGSPLSPESFDYVYSAVKQDVCLSSISGGTDILGCFALGSTMLPVYRGELQTRSLGLRVEVFDQRGESIRGAKGELVCTAPFPSMPVGFWNDPDGSRYHRAYFERFPGVWHHGDFVELTDNQGMIFFGRSDAVLNPGGIRIGTAEIYNQVEKLDEVVESIAIGQEWQGDVRVVLFVKLREGAALTAELENAIRARIREGASPFHVPKKILRVDDIPRTRSGKIVELAVREVVHGRAVDNIEAIANPEALACFSNRPELGEE